MASPLELLGDGIRDKILAKNLPVTQSAFIGGVHNFINTRNEPTFIDRDNNNNIISQESPDVIGEIYRPKNSNKNQYEPENSSYSLYSVNDNSRLIGPRKPYVNSDFNLNIGDPAYKKVGDIIGTVVTGRQLGVDVKNKKLKVIPNFDIRASLVGRALSSIGLFKDTPLGLIGAERLLVELTNRVASNVQKETIGRLDLKNLLGKGGGILNPPNSKITVTKNTNQGFLGTLKTIGKTIIDMSGYENPKSSITDDASIFYSERIMGDMITSSADANEKLVLFNTGNGQYSSLLSNLAANEGFGASILKGNGSKARIWKGFSPGYRNDTDKGRRYYDKIGDGDDKRLKRSSSLYERITDGGNSALKLVKGRSVIDENGLVKISPLKKQGRVDVKKYMFSIENLAWDGYATEGNLDPCEIGNGDTLTGSKGRIMWFPPYDISFTETTNVKWDSHEFIGRTEPIYTYINSERTGNLNFKIIVDHPSFINTLRESKGKEIEEFFQSGLSGSTLTSSKISKGDKDNIEAALNKPTQAVESVSQVITESISVFFPNGSSSLLANYEDGSNTYRDNGNIGDISLNAAFLSELPQMVIDVKEKANPKSIVINIEGFATDFGAPSFNNDALAKQRAEEVKKTLLIYGIPNTVTFNLISTVVSIETTDQINSDIAKKGRVVNIKAEYTPEKDDKVSESKTITTDNPDKNTDNISKSVFKIGECDYFDYLEKTKKFIYDSLGEKIKYFHPAFHSMTPEGLNSRLTFLLQCTKPGPSIDNRSNKKIDSPFNLAFGKPPICILRIGDFFYTKIAIDNVTFQYEPLQWDLNPEGIGVQPMIVGVSLQIRIIGGSTPGGPINRLQNAVSFNFFANTTFYDERSDDISEDGKIINGKKIIKEEKKVTVTNDSKSKTPETNQEGENNKVDGDTGNNNKSGTPKGDISDDESTINYGNYGGKIAGILSNLFTQASDSLIEIFGNQKYIQTDAFKVGNAPQNFEGFFGGDATTLRVSIIKSMFDTGYGEYGTFSSSLSGFKTISDKIKTLKSSSVKIDQDNGNAGQSVLNHIDTVMNTHNTNRKTETSDIKDFVKFYNEEYIKKTDSIYTLSSTTEYTSTLTAFDDLNIKRTTSLSGSKGNDVNKIKDDLNTSIEDITNYISGITFGDIPITKT